LVLYLSRVRSSDLLGGFLSQVLFLQTRNLLLTFEAVVISNVAECECNISPSRRSRYYHCRSLAFVPSLKGHP